MTSLIITEPATAPNQSTHGNDTPTAEPIATKVSIPTSSPAMIKSVLQSVSDLAEMQKNTFEILQKQMLETQSAVLRSLLSTVERRIKAVKTEPPHDETSKLIKVGIK
nr:hypothetical protein [Myxococcaceae bacterium MCy9487]